MKGQCVMCMSLSLDLVHYNENDIFFEIKHFFAMGYFHFNYNSCIVKLNELKNFITKKKVNYNMPKTK